jgi:hypothetical protein
VTLAPDGHISTLWNLTFNEQQLRCVVYRGVNGLELRLESLTAVILSEPFDMEPRALARSDEGGGSLPALSPMLVEMIVDGEVDPERRHRPEARGGEFVVLWSDRHVPRTDPGNVNEATDRYHPHRSMVERFQQRILLPNFVELERMVSGDPVGQ